MPRLPAAVPRRAKQAGAKGSPLERYGRSLCGVTMLIDDRAPPSPVEGGPRPVEPNWRMWAWIAVTAVLAFAAFHATGFAGYLVLCGAVGSGCKAATAALDYGGGLTEWRQ